MISASHLPRYNGKYWENNQKLAIEIAEIAESKGINPSPTCLSLDIGTK